MTTTVSIIACVSEEKEVVVEVKSSKTGEAIEKSLILQNGEKADVYVYDDREIVIRETLKA